MISEVNKQNIVSLTSFRFITAFIVFLFHCTCHFQWHFPSKYIARFLEHGAVFMSGFFVLSGFIMSHVYQNTDFKDRTQIINFYWRRFAKIYPCYVFATIVYFTIFRNFSFSEYIRIFVNDIFLVQGFFKSMFDIGINGGTWSLTVEAFLYFLFPLILLISTNRNKIFTAGIIISSIVTLNLLLHTSDYIYANPIFRLGDFICGIGIYFLKERIKRYTRAIHPIVILSLFSCTILLGAAKYQYFIGVINNILFSIWLVCVYYSSNKLYNNIVSEYLGRISYSFYLWQFFAMEFGKKLISMQNGVSLHLVVITMFFINILLASLSYHMIEELFRKKILRRIADEK